MAITLVTRRTLTTMMMRTPDAYDSSSFDRDNDNCPDAVDQFVLDAAECTDWDGDDVGDNADLDDDNDERPCCV